jgi:hypothetical protein
MKIVYIVHPISGDISGNIQKILKIVKDINLSKPDIVPFAPYITDVLALDDNDPTQRERGIANDIAILHTGMVNELWVYGPKISAGMKAEIKLAFELSIPIVVMTPKMDWPEWLLRVAIPTGYFE